MTVRRRKLEKIKQKKGKTAGEKRLKTLFKANV